MLLCNELLLCSNSYSQQQSICLGDSAYLSGAWQSDTGIYFDTLVSTMGCDSIIETTLATLSLSVAQSISICSGDSVYLSGAWQLNAGIYHDTLVGTMGCDSLVTTTLTLVNGMQNYIGGVIYFNNDPIASGQVKLISKPDNSPQSMFVFDSAIVDMNGAYYFENVPAGNYLVKALGDTALYDNVTTYSDSTNHWQKAIEYSVLGCLDSISSLDVHLIDFPTVIGFGNITGNVTNGGNKINGEYTGVCVSLEDKISHELVAGTFVDDLDNFYFNQIPEGNYLVYFDIVGYENDTINGVIIDSSHADFDLSVSVDDTLNTVVVSSLTGVDINERGEDVLFGVFPNPANDFITVSGNTEIINSIDIYDASGMLHLHLSQQEIIDVSKLPEGIYFIQITNKKGVRIESKKIIIE